jgi:hypothetical protein
MTFLRRCHNIRNQRIVEGKRDDDGRKAPAARFEISIDGVPRSYRDRREIAVEAAGRLMAKYPDSAVAVKDLHSGERVAADYRLDLGPR